MPVISAPAFISAELRHVSQSDQENLGNFSSTLTLNVSQLEQQHITQLRCGDPVTFETVPVNVQLRQESPPENPRLIDTAYKSTELIISWNPSVIYIII